MKAPPELARELHKVKDELRDSLSIVGVRPGTIRFVETSDRSYVTLELTLAQARFVAGHLNRTELHSCVLPDMVLWSERLERVGKVHSVTSEWATLCPLSDTHQWRSAIGGLRPALLSEIAAAQKAQELQQRWRN